MRGIADAEPAGACDPHDRASGRARCGRFDPSSCATCVVRTISVCASLDLDEIEALGTVSERVSFAPKETLFMQGAAADAVYNVTGGALRLYKLLPDGRRQIVGFLLPGDFVGLALSERYGFAADAIDHVDACRFERETFVAFVERTPHFLMRLHQAAAHELTVAQDHMVLLGQRAADEKVAGFLLMMRERLRRLGASSVTIPLPMTRQDLADYLGLTLETVSRVISRLARDRIILVVPDGVRIMDPLRLDRLGAI